KIRRKGINNFIDYYVNKYDMHNDSTFGLFSSIGFDVGAIRSICAPIYVGASLDIIPNDIRLNIDKLNKHFIDKGVTHTTLPTQVARMFINEIESTSLKVLNTGGEKLGDIVYATDYSFIDSYGPTECCVSVCDIEVKDKMDSSSIGHLFTNTKGYILDNENRRVPIGAVGELCIAGKQTADGYLNRPKETAASFVKNPFDSNEEYGVMYRTGDLVRILEDGTFAIVGRRDSQVKIRGNRVELGEVESVIMNIDLVENVTVQTADNNGLMMSLRVI
uniref:AMP-binding protein n=1 Tax=uncultured Methanobrevibacter sp. TaxID=253161 RepID=UPI0025E7BFA9